MLDDDLQLTFSFDTGSDMLVANCSFFVVTTNCKAVRAFIVRQNAIEERNDHSLELRLHIHRTSMKKIGLLQEKINAILSHRLSFRLSHSSYPHDLPHDGHPGRDPGRGTRRGT